MDAATGEHGDLLDLLRRQCGPRAFDEARAFLRQWAPPALPRHPGPIRGGKHLAERMRRMWEMCRPIEGTLAERYLRSRHLAYTRFPALRFHPALYYRDGDRTETFRELPALVAQGKGPVAAPRKSLGSIAGAAVWLGLRQSTIVVCERLETTLSFLAARPRLGAAAALSAAGLAAFVPPAVVTRLVIAPDNDVAGTRAVERLRRRCEDRGVGAIVVAPERNDFNDDLRALGAEALAARLVRAVAMIAAQDHAAHREHRVRPHEERAPGIATSIARLPVRSFLCAHRASSAGRRPRRVPPPSREATRTGLGSDVRSE